MTDQELKLLGAFLVIVAFLAIFVTFALWPAPKDCQLHKIPLEEYDHELYCPKCFEEARNK